MNDQLKTAFEDWLKNVCHESFRTIIDERVERALLELQELVEAHAAAIWIKCPDRDAQVIAFNVGDRGSEIEGVVEQSLDSGLISQAFNEGKTVCDQGVFGDPASSDDVDKQLGQRTVHQVCTPFSMLGKQVGTITAIQTLSGGVMHPNTHWEFDEVGVKRFEVFSQLLAGTLESNLLLRLV